jgi:transposase
MTVSQEMEAEIRRLFFAEHWKRGTIAAQLGVHLDVVKRVTGSVGMKPGTPHPRPSKLDPYTDFIDETLARYPRLCATRIHDMLRGRGYTGSTNTLRRYVKKARPKPKAEAFLRVETLPGEQAQVDWAHVGEIVVPGGKRALWAFVMVLAHSRASFAELVLSLDVYSLRRSLVRAAAHFGGLPRQWLFDNAKTIVLERHGDVARSPRCVSGKTAPIAVEGRRARGRNRRGCGGSMGRASTACTSTPAASSALSSTSSTTAASSTRAASRTSLQISGVGRAPEVCRERRRRARSSLAELGEETCLDADLGEHEREDEVPRGAAKTRG